MLHFVQLNIYFFAKIVKRLVKPCNLITFGLNEAWIYENNKQMPSHVRGVVTFVYDHNLLN